MTGVQGRFCVIKYAAVPAQVSFVESPKFSFNTKVYGGDLSFFRASTSTLTGKCPSCIRRQSPCVPVSV